jgi:general secretion pathway protein G
MRTTSPTMRPRGPRRRHVRGVTLLELTIASVVIALVAAIAVPAYRSYVERVRVTRAIADIAEISGRIQRFHTVNFRLPASLSEAGAADLRDPWGRPYAYLLFDRFNRGARRKDRSLVPINSEFDLYSVGPDGRTRPPLTVPVSHDDVVRARDGGFIGKAADF